MSNKKRKIISHEEIWDDTALIESWDEALDEYKLYHSIQARGERVADVFAKTSQSIPELNDQDLKLDTSNQSEPQPDGIGEQIVELEDGEVEGESASTNLLNPQQNDSNLTEGADAQQQKSSSSHAAHHSQSGPNALPHALVTGDEALKNLMMSWYYAGYYTGLYEGQHRAKREQQQST